MISKRSSGASSWWYLDLNLSKITFGEKAPPEEEGEEATLAGQIGALNGLDVVEAKV